MKTFTHCGVCSAKTKSKKVRNGVVVCRKCL